MKAELTGKRSSAFRVERATIRRIVGVTASPTASTDITTPLEHIFPKRAVTPSLKGIAMEGHRPNFPEDLGLDWWRHRNARMHKKGRNRDPQVPATPYSRIYDHVQSEVLKRSGMQAEAIRAAAEELNYHYEHRVLHHRGPRFPDHFEGFMQLIRGRRMEPAYREGSNLVGLTDAQLLLVWAARENDAARRLFHALDSRPKDRTLLLECAVQAAVGAAKALAAAQPLKTRTHDSPRPER